MHAALPMANLRAFHRFRADHGFRFDGRFCRFGDLFCLSVVDPDPRFRNDHRFVGIAGFHLVGVVAWLG